MTPRTVVDLKNAVFWDVALCRSCVNRRFRGTYRLHVQGRKIREPGASVSRWLQTELPVAHRRSTRPRIPEDGILHSHRRENLKSYNSRFLFMCILFDVFSFHEFRYPCNRPWRPIGLWDVEAPTFSKQSAHRWWWGCQPYAPAALNPPKDSWYSFLLEAESTTGS
jgi:hypothetical protein